MDYNKPNSDYKTKERIVEKKYYTEKERQEGKNELPTFRQIFYDLPKSGSIASFSDFHEGVVYFSSMDTYAYAVNADTGELVWKFKTGAPTRSTPLVHHNRVYFGSNDGYFYCLDLNGNLVWKKNTGDIIASSAIGIGDRIFIGNGAGYFFCFSKDGEELWKYKTGDGIIAVPSSVNGLVFIGSYDKNVYAFDLEGALKWKFTAGERTGAALVMENGKMIFSNNKRSWDKPPQAQNPLLYCASYDNCLYCLDTKGNVVWKFNCGTSIPGGIGGENGTVYAGTISGTIFAIDAKNGNEKWNFRTGGMITAGAEIKDGMVFFTSFDQKLYCLSENGNKLWDFLTGGPIVSRPLIVCDKIYFGSSDTFFYCLNLKERNVEWTFQTGFGFPDVFQSKIDEMKNAFIEYDRKIFKVWVPETPARSPAQINVADYTAKLGIDSTFKYGGIGSYLSKGKKKDAYGRN